MGNFCLQAEPLLKIHLTFARNWLSEMKDLPDIASQLHFSPHTLNTAF